MHTSLNSVECITHCLSSRETAWQLTATALPETKHSMNYTDIVQRIAAVH